MGIGSSQDKALTRALAEGVETGISGFAVRVLARRELVSEGDLYMVRFDLEARTPSRTD